MPSSTQAANTAADRSAVAGSGSVPRALAVRDGLLTVHGYPVAWCEWRAGDGQSANLGLVANHDCRLGQSGARDPLGSLDRPATPSRIMAAPGESGAFATRASTRTAGRRCSSAGMSNLILSEEAESPPAERPCDEKTTAAAAWLIDEARRLSSATRFVDELAWRILAHRPVFAAGDVVPRHATPAIFRRDLVARWRTRPDSGRHDRIPTRGRWSSLQWRRSDCSLPA
jgi:hypothetical protein